MTMNKGISVAGNAIVDYYKLIEAFPERGMLSTILDVFKTFGSCVMNVIINLSKINSSSGMKEYRELRKFYEKYKAV